MKTLRYIGMALLAVVLSVNLSSCGIMNDATSNQNLVQTNVILNQKNYKVISNVKGESKQCYVFGIGGLSKKSLRESAMSDMFQNADLKEGARAIINTNVQYKYQFYILWFKCKAIATGTIIEFTE